MRKKKIQKDIRKINNTIAITQKRRLIQAEYNELHGITPKTVKKQLIENLSETFYGKSSEEEPDLDKENIFDAKEIARNIKNLEKEMKKAAKEYRFEEAAKFRDQLHYLKSLQIIEDHPL